MFTDDAMRQGWAERVNVISGRPAVGLKKWLATATYQVDPSSVPDKVVLNLGDYDSCAEAYAFDINRLASSALETLQSISEVTNLPRSLAWLGIKLYYSSYFSAHVILRMNGVSCNYFEIDEILHLRRTAVAYGLPNASQINSGSYKSLLDYGARTLTIVKETKLSSHEFLWHAFMCEIDAMTQKLESSALPSTYIKDVQDLLRTLLKTLNRGGCANGNWLSRMRNAINYRHEYELWYPHRTSHRADEWIDKISRAFQQDPRTLNLSSSSEPVAFFNACILINVICRGALDDMAKRCSDGRSFLSFGPLAFSRMVEQRAKGTGQKTGLGL